jgi:head-tail adaptor
MRAGVLDRRITIQRPGVVDDPVYGPQPGGWSDVTNAVRIPAQRVDSLPSQSESVQGGLRMADRPARLRIRYMKGLTSDMRIVMHDEDDQIYEISGGPAEIGRREWIEFTIRAYSS